MPTVPTDQHRLEVANLLTCSEQPYAKASKVIGRDGGTIVVGSHVLVIPGGALSRRVEIKAEQVPGRHQLGSILARGLRVRPPGGADAELRELLALPLKKRVVYTDELLKVLELLPSQGFGSPRASPDDRSLLPVRRGVLGD